MDCEERAKEDSTRMLVSDECLAAGSLKMDVSGLSRNWAIAQMLDRDQCIGFDLVRHSSG